MSKEDCRSCPSISGEKRVSPGPWVHKGTYWWVDHAYPSALLGWLVLVLKRHAEALHELTPEEFTELGVLIEKTVAALRKHTGCAKEYVMCLAEAPGFNHIHVHVVPRAGDISPDLKGTGIFGMLKVTPDEAVTAEQITEFCLRLQPEYV